MSPVFEINDLGILNIDTNRGYLTIERDEGSLSLYGAPSSLPLLGPRNLVASKISSTDISLNWDDWAGPETLDYYNIYRSISPDVEIISGNRIASAVSTSDYTDNGLSTGTTYYYRVTAVTTLGNETPGSNEDSATPSMTTYNAFLLDDWDDGVFNTTRDNFTSRPFVSSPGAPTSSPGGFTVTSRPLWNNLDSGLTVTSGNLVFSNSSNSPGCRYTHTKWDTNTYLRIYELKFGIFGSSMNKPLDLQLRDSTNSNYGYYIRFDYNGALYFRRLDSGGSVNIVTGSWNKVYDTYNIYRLEWHYGTAETDGSLILYENDVELLRAVDTTYTAHDYIQIGTFSAMALSAEYRVDWLRIY